MNIKPRFLLLTALLVLLAGLAGWLAARQLAERIIAEWAERYAEKQVLYDKARALQPIMREIALTRQLAATPAILDWARNPDDPALATRAFAHLEGFRDNFAEHAYFVALNPSGRYFHNNAKGEYTAQPQRYVLHAINPDDRWFFDLIRQQRDLHLNVNPDGHLGVTKLWIDVLLRHGNDILGVAGTGLNLQTFLHNVVDTPQAGMTTLFIDHDGAIQLFRDQDLIDYASLSKKQREKSTIDLLFDRDEDRIAIRAGMKELETMQRSVISRMVVRNGQRYLAGLAWLPEVNWYEVTLIDLDVLLPLSSFVYLALVGALSLLAALVVFNLALSRLVLRPLSWLEQAVQDVQDGNFDHRHLPTEPNDEVGRLIRHFSAMAETVRESRRELENRITERTRALEHLSKADPLTDLLNRRGMTERLNGEINRARRNETAFGLMLIDIDHFKQINDQYGHPVGDQALLAVARIIASTIRPYDAASRWGGDEFLVLIQDCDEALLANLGERLRLTLAGKDGLSIDGPEVFRVSISIGATVAQAPESLEAVLHEADQALYAAKAAGRNCLRVYQSPMLF